MAIPTGTVTFLFTDIEGSTRLWERDASLAKEAVARHDALLRAAIERHGGFVFKTVGDAFCAAFQEPGAALRAAVDLQRGIAEGTFPFRVRAGLHAGITDERDGDYFGPTVNRVARLMSLAVGGQTLVSAAVETSLASARRDDVTLKDLGTHRLKDLSKPERVWQVVDSTLPSDFPPLKSVDAFPNNLPHQVNAFVGRDREMAEVERLVRGNRLVTLVGAGGVGKTRLAIQAAGVLLGDFPRGAWFVDLAPLSDPALVEKAVATALGVREEPGRPLVDAVVAAIGDGPVLLVLDNAEHVVDASARLAEVLLSRTPRLHVLATSREPLGLSGEITWRVPSLGLDATPGASGEAQGRAGQEGAAVALFAERARAAAPDFRLTDANRDAVLQICRRLDGIPLAIELAASRAAVLSPRQIAERLDDRFRLLTGGSRTALPRQRTLEACVAWGWDLLDASERSLLSRLSVFAGGCDLEAAEAVCSGAPVYDVLDALSRLVSKSFVVAEEDDFGAKRYRLLETIRQFARDRLVSSGEASSVRDRHRDHYLALAHRTAPTLRREDQTRQFARLDREQENFRAAMDSCIHGGPAAAAAGLSAACAIRRFWTVRGHLEEGRDTVESLLSRAGPAADDALRALALESAAVLELRLGADVPRARAWAEEALALRRRIGDPVGLALGLSTMGRALLAGNDFPQARAHLEQGLAVLSRADAGDERTTIDCDLGAVCAELGDLDAAVRYLEEAIRYAERVGDDVHLAYGLGRLAYVSLVREDLAESKALLLREVAAHRRLGNAPALGFALNVLGVVHMRLDELGAATAALEEALAIRERIGQATAEGTRMNLAILRMRHGDFDGARTLLATSFRMARGDARAHSAARALLHLADVERAADRFEDSARLLGAAQHLAGERGLSTGARDATAQAEMLEKLLSALGAERVEALRSEGAAASDATVDAWVAALSSPPPP